MNTLRLLGNVRTVARSWWWIHAWTFFVVFSLVVAGAPADTLCIHLTGGSHQTTRLHCGAASASDPFEPGDAPTVRGTGCCDHCIHLDTALELVLNGVDGPDFAVVSQSADAQAIVPSAELSTTVGRVVSESPPGVSSGPPPTAAPLLL
ncbi:MAG: hypothetical protein GY906_00120 [bacterium]|nr:hypothetical protein [bacterium]